MDKVVVAYFWRIEKKSLPFAFISMARDRGRLRRSPGVHFAKMLGTGTGENFTPSDADLSRWGALVVIDEAHLDAIDTNSVIKGWNKGQPMKCVWCLIQSQRTVSGLELIPLIGATLHQLM